MLKNTCFALSSTAIFVAGFSLGSIRQQGIAHAQAGKHVYELRTYTAPEGKLGELNSRFRNHTIRIFNNHGMKSVLYMTPQDAPDSQNTLIYILEHPSREAAKKAWADFQADPEWKKVSAESEPENPQKDILLFLMNYAPLERWQHTILEIIRDEAYYFAPQGMTKILNEGWASYWHSKIMTKKALKDGELVDFADHHSGVVATQPGRLNPYKLGLELLRDVEERWNKGQFGKEYDECEDIAAKRTWDKQLGLGRDKLFEIRRMYNDVTFIDAFLTPEFCMQQKMFSFRYNRDTDLYEIASREFKEIKEKLLFRLTNFGQPFIYVEDGNYNNRGELYLRHRHEGVDLKIDYARDTLRNLHKLWSRPVHIETVVDDKKRLISFDGKDFAERKID